MSQLVAMFIEFGGQVLLGSVIIGVGFWLSNFASEAIRRIEGSASGVLSGIARIAILGLVLAMGLRAMGLADDIVNMAFGLTLGAIAVAVALFLWAWRAGSCGKTNGTLARPTAWRTLIPCAEASPWPFSDGSGGLHSPYILSF